MPVGNIFAQYACKKPENAEFSGFFDAMNSLLLQTPKK